MTSTAERALGALVRTDPEFGTLAELLYGAADQDVIYADVFHKREPDKDGNFQRRVAVASNLLGLTAGTAAIGSTLQDTRLKDGGKISRGLYKTGQKIPSPLRNRLARMSPKAQAAAAAGAAGLQLANVGGDVVVGATLPKPEKKRVSKASIPKVDDMVNGVLTAASRKGKHVNEGENTRRLGGALHAPLEHKKLTGAFVATGLVANERGKRKGRQQGFQAGYYAKADVVQKPMPDLEIAGTFSKFDDDKRQAFGYASVVKKDGLPVIDRQGDYIDADEMEKAAYHYVQKSRVGGDMHRRKRDEYGIDKAHHVSDLIESMVFTPEKCKAMGLPDEVAKKLDGHWWVGYQIHDEDTWNEVRKQGRTGFSIHGRGKRVDTTVDELVGY